MVWQIVWSIIVHERYSAITVNYVVYYDWKYPLRVPQLNQVLHPVLKSSLISASYSRILPPLWAFVLTIQHYSSLPPLQSSASSKSEKKQEPKKKVSHPLFDDDDDLDWLQ